jgi:hypothetical protein
MMQAAQMAAAAAMAEAVARETGANSGGGERSREMDMDASNSMMDGDQLAFLHALQGSDMGDSQAQIMGDINMMGLDPNDGEVQSLLQMLSQQQQEQENRRPDEHYLTIAQNGRLLLEQKEGRQASHDHIAYFVLFYFAIAGMILEATKTVTGFPPDALLMTSA